MTRQHIHLALSTPPAQTSTKPEGKVTSGIRATSHYLLYLDVPLLLERESISAPFSPLFVAFRSLPLPPPLLSSFLSLCLNPTFVLLRIFTHRQRSPLPLNQRRPPLSRRSQRFFAREDRTRVLLAARRKEDWKGRLEERRRGRWCGR